MFSDFQEKPKILIACNTLTSVSGEVYPYHMKMFYNLGRRHLDYDFVQLTARRMSIDNFRNYATETAITNNCRYLMFLDDDMKIPADTFGLLLDACERQGYGIVAALNYIRGYPFKIMSFKYDLSARGRRLTNLTQRDIDNVPLGSVIPCDAIGTATCLIDVNVLRKITKPYFLTGPHGTEDIYMCLKARDAVPELKIGTHTGVQTGHLIDPEIISHDTRASLMRYVESYMTVDEVHEAQRDDPRLAIVPDVGGRDLHYEDIMGGANEPLVA